MRLETLKYGSLGRNLPLYSDQGEQVVQQGDFETVEAWFDQAVEQQAIALTLSNYIVA